MRVAQMVVRGASLYERKSQRIDAAALVAAGHEVVLIEAPARAPAPHFDVTHVYGPPSHVASGKARVVITPEVVPEAVEELWFDDEWSAR
ncbi:MAG: hypothetical protein ACXVJT_18030, partial [Thermoanaerobaculia bacterium]